uniref:Uncharacterized protein n=1 Tax=Ditylenchus dipsaci TaxID=166011 RepID=A0A915DA66_9BILA
MKNILLITKFACFTALLIILLSTLEIKAGDNEGDALDETTLTNIENPNRQPKSKGKILYMAESRYFSHFNFSVQLANTLHAHGYEVIGDGIFSRG